MLELEYGIIKSFDPRELFGFLKVLDENGQATDEEVFFHFNDGQFVDIEGGDEIHFVGREKSGMRMWLPRVGEKLAFDRSPGKGDRDKARPWTYAEGYDNCVRKLTEPFYRVIMDLKFGYNDIRDKHEVIWEGQGGNAMAAEYPIRVLDGKLDDPLRKWADMSAGSTTHYSFEMWVPDDIVDGPEGEAIPVPGYWQSCNDPRPRSDMAREMESASESAS